MICFVHKDTQAKRTKIYFELLIVPLWFVLVV